jgi:hypothetical protein
MPSVPNIENTDRILDATALTGQTDFTVPWPVIAASLLEAAADLVVSVDGTVLAPADYSFAGNTISGINGIWNGGTVTLDAPCAGGERVIIYSDRAPRRTGSFLEGKTLPMSTLDQLQDDFAVQMRDMSLKLKRAPLIPADDFLDGVDPNDLGETIAAQAVLAQQSAATAVAAAAAAVGLVYLIVNTVAILRAVASVAAPITPNAYLRSYSGTLGDGAAGFFFWNSTDSRTDNGGTIVKPNDISGASAGRWNRLAPDSAFRASWFGIKADNSTDNKTAIQTLVDAAHSHGQNEVLFDFATGTVKFTDTITLYEGTVVRGLDRMRTKLFCSSTSNPAFSYQTSNGTSVMFSPRFYDFQLMADKGIKINDPSNGFTDDNTTQNYLENVQLQGLKIIAQNFGASGTYPFSISKTQTGEIRGCYCQGHLTAKVDGADNLGVSHNTFDAVSFVATSHGTWGNGLKADHCYFPNIPNGTYPIIDEYHSMDVDTCWVETPGTLPALVRINQVVPQTARVENCWVGANGSQITHLVEVNDTTDGTTATGLISLVCRNNNGGLLTNGNVIFNNGDGLSYYTGTGGIRRKITHCGNVSNNGDAGFPFNSKGSSLDEGHLPPGVMARFSPNLDGLNFNNYGLTVLCKNGAFVMTQTGSSNFLEFSNTDFPAGGETVDLWVFAQQPGGGGTVRGALMDASGTITSYVSGVVPSTPTWVKLKTGTPGTGYKGCRIYSDVGGLLLFEAALVKQSYPTS